MPHSIFQQNSNRKYMCFLEKRPHTATTQIYISGVNFQLMTCAVASCLPEDSSRRRLATIPGISDYYSEPLIIVLQNRHVIYVTFWWELICLLDFKLWEECVRWLWGAKTMMASSNGNLFRKTGHLCAEFIGPRWIPSTKASNAELWCFLWSASE